MVCPNDNVPRHIAIIMDGNGRWARQRGLPRAKGHEKGGETVQRVVQMCLDRGVPWLTLYAFSTENWGRPAAEVKGLMEMLYLFLKRNQSMLVEKNVRLRAIGELEMLPEKCRRVLRECIQSSASHSALTLTLALSYGSRRHHQPQPVDRRHARPRPSHPHFRGDAPFQLSALAGKLRRIVAHPRAVARLLSG